MNETTIDNQVAVGWTTPSYPKLTYEDNEQSPLYKSLQNLFVAFGLDKDNPFSDYIKPDGIALIKPNWVRDFNPLGYNLDSLISHPTLIWYLIVFLARAMQEKGTIVIGDAPLQNCNFENLLKSSGLQEVIARAKLRFPKVTFVVEDWRLTTLKRTSGLKSWTTKGVQSSRDQFTKVNVESHRVVDLGDKSFLEEIREYAPRFRVTKYKPSLMLQHHTKGKHEYLVTNRIFQVDFMINLAKMKTHIKAGITGALKSLIGINGHKEFLPHHIRGSYFEGGDNYCLPNRFRAKYEDIYDWYWENYSEMDSTKRKLGSVALNTLWNLSNLLNKDHISAGSWQGNDTVWRTTLDLNHLLYFFSDTRARNIINIIDGIVAGQGDGPLIPTPKPAGVLIMGKNPAYVDAVMAKLMGYVVARIPTVYQAIYNRKSRFGNSFLENFEIDNVDMNGVIRKVSFGNLPNLDFKKPYFWRGAAIPSDSDVNQVQQTSLDAEY